MNFHIEHWNATTKGPAICQDLSCPRVISPFVREHFPDHVPYNIERYTDPQTGHRAVHVCLRHPNGGTATFFVDIVCETDDHSATVLASVQAT